MKDWLTNFAQPFLANKYQTVAIAALLLYFLLTQSWLFAVLMVVCAGALYLAEKADANKESDGAGEQKERKSFIPENIGNKLEALNNSKVLYIILVLALVIFIIFKKTGGLGLAAGFIGGIALLALVLVEVLIGLYKGGIGNEIKESVTALLVALVVWFGLSLLLGVPSPINAIVSCSMVPQLERGDLVLLQGGEPNAPEWKMTSAEIAQITNVGKVTFLGADASELSGLDSNGQLEVNGSLFFYCIAQNFATAECKYFVNKPDAVREEHGPISFYYSMCKRVGRNDAQSGYTPCISSIEYKGQRISENISNSVVVYQSPASDLFALEGDTIHRVFVRIRDENGKYYVLTKGDNNAYFDLQAYVGNQNGQEIDRGNSLVSGAQIKGKVLQPIPYVGYFKIFLSGVMQPGLLAMDQGCDTVFEKFKSS